MNNRLYIIATGLVLLLAIVFFNLSPDSSARLKRVLASFHIPLFSAQKTAEATGEILVDQTAPRKVLLQEIHELKRQNQILEQCPPELSGDIVDRGIVMAGGGGLLRGIDRLVAKETQLPVTIAEDPLISVANGTGKVLQNIDYWRNAAATA